MFAAATYFINNNKAIPCIESAVGTVQHQYCWGGIGHVILQYNGRKGPVYSPMLPQIEEVGEIHHATVGLCHMSAIIAAAIDGSISRSSILASGALRGLI
jgi:hypothetical protein